MCRTKGASRLLRRGREDAAAGAHGVRGRCPGWFMVRGELGPFSVRRSAVEREVRRQKVQDAGVDAGLRMSIIRDGFF